MPVESDKGFDVSHMACWRNPFSTRRFDVRGTRRKKPKSWRDLHLYPRLFHSIAGVSVRLDPLPRHQQWLYRYAFRGVQRVPRSDRSSDFHGRKVDRRDDDRRGDGYQRSRYARERKRSELDYRD